MTLICADAAGCAPITITDISAARLAFAKKLLPRVRTVQVVPGQDVVPAIKEAMGEAIKVVVECTGQESSIEAGIKVSM